MELSKAFYEEILAHARAGYPNEACGVVAGRDGRPVAVYPMANAERSPVIYRFDEREQLKVFREIEDQGWDLLAFFHSHPHTEAFPSPTDRTRAHWPDPVTGRPVPAYPGTRYLILSLGDRPELRAFRFEDGEPVEEEMTIA
ncbi:MAG TPA: M67 family metallopeptidase [Actinomycetota bacterium]